MSDYFNKDVVAVRVGGRITNNLDALKGVASNPKSGRLITRGMATMMADLDMGPPWRKISKAPNMKEG